MDDVARQAYTVAMALTREQMWARVLESDPRADGRFLTGVLTTGIYCLPSCRARKPRPDNVRFFTTEADARAAGLRPCKKCRPDAFYAGHNPQWDGLLAARRRLFAQPADFADVEAFARAAGVGPSRLHELTWSAWQETPAAVMLDARLERARHLLLSTRTPVVEVAYEAGFGSLSAFNARFREGVGVSPQVYRKLSASDGFRIELPPSYNVERVLRYLGRDPASLTEQVEGRTWRFGLWLGDVPLEARADFGEGSVSVACPRPDLLPELLWHVRRRLGLQVDAEAFERLPLASRLVAGRCGLRIPLMTDVFECLCWIVLGQQVNFRYASTVRRRLVEAWGVPTGGTLLAPPPARAMASLAVDEIARLGTTGRKAETLISLARGWEDGRLPWTAEEPIPQLQRRLTDWRGLGPWSVQYLFMRCLGLPDCVPVGDAALVTALRLYFELPERPATPQVLALMAPFAPYRSLASFHLWRWSEEKRNAVGD